MPGNSFSSLDITKDLDLDVDNIEDIPLEELERIFNAKLEEAFPLSFMGETRPPPSPSKVPIDALVRMSKRLSYKPPGIEVDDEYRFIYRIPMPRGDVNEPVTEGKRNRKGNWVVDLKFNDKEVVRVNVPGRFDMEPTRLKSAGESLLVEWRLRGPKDDTVKEYFIQASERWARQRRAKR